MPRTRHLFRFKCANGHVTEKSFPLGTRLEDEDETTCVECLKRGILKPAYVIFIEPEPKEKKWPR
jgi:hypothetical protein